ncbi:MAG TPA: hypothetical protein PKD10_12120 [Paracoccaceae bacterium]|nr:hypothetical protein [Paracoccaceae bacterium]HMO71660.1 hypothetical protein [Paracoccaceae bacterium]
MPHFEIHVSDTARARGFYAGLFGWSFRPMSEEMGYFLIEGEGIGAGKGMTAGMLPRHGAAPPSGGPVRGGNLVVEVAACDERYSWALANGGAEAMPPTDFPGIGRCAYVEDGEGNIVGMITPERGA